MSRGIYDNLWIEKYRPKELNDMSMDNGLKTNVESWIKDGECPNLLFLSSCPGTGKSTLARILLNNLTPNESDYMELNGSGKDSRGIAILEHIENFLTTPSISSKIKIVYIDEFDGFTEDAQKGLRALIEKYQNTGRFILTANYAHKIFDPIKSRMMIFEFKRLPMDECQRIIFDILKKENVTYDINHVKNIITNLYPDMRSTINTLQRMIITGNDGNVLDMNTLGVALGDEQILLNLVQQITNNINNIQLVNQLLNSILETCKNPIDYKIAGTLLFDNIAHPIAKYHIGNFINSLSRIVEPRMGFYCLAIDIINSYRGK